MRDTKQSAIFFLPLHFMKVLSFICVIFVAKTAMAVDGDATDNRIGKILPALGISSSFGRWDDVVNLGYDPHGATNAYIDSDHFLDLLALAIEQWELVSGIRFNILSAGTYPDDHDHNADDRDGIVRVGWQDSPDSFAGWAGPRVGYYDEALGYNVYHDGNVILNINSWQERDDRQMVRMLVHELGHLIGLGHSDNPISVMFANPYNSLFYPREDDIKAVQILYGPSNFLGTEDHILSQYLFDSSDLSSIKKIDYLFDSNQSSSYSGELALQLVSDDSSVSKLTEVNIATPNDDWIRIIAPVGNWANTSDLDVVAKIYLVDPDGYPYRVVDTRFECQAGHACWKALSIAQVNALKTFPGNWKIYILENSDSAVDNHLLAEFDLPVNIELGHNLPPMATVKVKGGKSPTSANFQVIASDFEGDEIELIWQLPGPRIDLDQDGFWDNGLKELIGHDRAGNWQEIDFGVFGDHSFYIQVNDRSKRYHYDTVGGNVAGRGFQTLLKVTVQLSDSNEPTVNVVSSAINSYEPSEDWPFPFTNVRPPSSLLSLNMIGDFDEDEMILNSCVQIFNNGSVSHIDGLEEIEIGLKVLDIDDGKVQLVKSRAFNESGQRLSGGWLPDCSGRFESTENLYTDYVDIGGVVYRVVFELVDESDLIFSLLDLAEVRPDKS